MAVLAYVLRTEARLLRADPDVVPTSPALMAFAQRRGEASFASRCASCHGVVGRGDLARGIPDLSDDDWLYGTGQLSDIEQVITYGIRSHNPKGWNLAIMPAYATAHPNSRDRNILARSPGDIGDLVEFLLFGTGNANKPVSAEDPAAIARGAALFIGAGGCYDCHAQDAKGDASIGAPNLTDQISLYGTSRDALLASISFGRAGVCPAWVSRIRPVEIRELAVFVYTLSRPARMRVREPAVGPPSSTHAPAAS